MIILALRTLTADCTQTVGRTDFGRTPLEMDLKGQYKSLMVKKLRYAIVKQYAKTSMILVFWVHLLRVAWSICTWYTVFQQICVGLSELVLRMCCKRVCDQPCGYQLLSKFFRSRPSCRKVSNSLINISTCRFFFW